MTTAYHGTAKNLTFEELVENDSINTYGIHFGSKKAAYVAVNKYDASAENADEETIDVFFDENPECLIEVVIDTDKILAGCTDSQANARDFLEKAVEGGYDAIAYKNEFEDIGSVSYVVFNPEVIREI
jgi:hypothetical protein